MLLTNGRIYALDSRNSVVDTLLVQNGRIVFAGSRGEVNPSASEETLNLHGRAVIPGLVDGHAHLTWDALDRARRTLNLGDIRSEEEVARVVGEAALTARPGEWIFGKRWDQNLWPTKQFPTRASLDRVALYNPVTLTRVDGHAWWANTAALQAAGITRYTPNPTGGRVEKGDDGEPTGLLVGTARYLVRKVQPLPPDERFGEAVREVIAECLSSGLTGIHEMGVDLYGLASYRRLIEREQFPFRLYAAIDSRSRQAWAYYRDRGRETIGRGHVVVGAFKLWCDGALGSRGALLHEPYCDDPGNIGHEECPADELYRLTLEAASRGFQVCIHAIGDRANTLTLDTFERALKHKPIPDHRFRIEHAQILTAEDFPRFRQMGVLPSMQPIHCISDMRWAEERVGCERLRGAYAWRSLLATGVVILGGSDFPVESLNPFHGIHAAVTRCPLTGEHPGWQPDQCMTREEAVRSYTTWNAYGSHQEVDLGSFESGKRADLVVLSEDVFTCPEERIKNILPVLTMVGGEVVFRR